MGPIQPYFVFATDKYQKSMVMQHGIVHVYHFFYTSDEFSKTSAIPDGCVDIFFKKDESGTHVQVCGTVLERTELDYPKHNEYFGIRLMPGELPSNLDVSLKELVENQVELDQVIRNKDVVKRIEDSRDWQESVRLFIGDVLSTKAKRNAETDEGKKKLAVGIRDAIINEKGVVQVSEIAESLGYSPRYINMVFGEYMGLSPKKFGKIMQLQETIQRINHEKSDFLTNVALEAGYFDQAHFIRDFKKYILMTPTEYRALIRDSAYEKRISVEDMRFW